MKAIVLKDKGLADKLEYADMPRPEIKNNQIMVRVFTTSVNQIDWKMGSGRMGELSYPWVPGMDFGGEVEAVGSRVKDFKKGDYVIGCSRGGTYAEFIAAEPGKTVLKPESISFVDANAAAYVSQTAWQALFKHGKLKKGQRVLIHGAAGAVGAFAVQFARVKGAYIYATAAGEDAGFVKGLGADVVIDYRTEDFTKIAKNLDLVIDLVGGESHKRSYPLIKKGGRLVTMVEPANEELAVKYGVTAENMVVKPSAADLRKIVALMDEGKVKADVAAVFWLKDMIDAWEYVLGKDPSKKVHGKVVIQVK